MLIVAIKVIITVICLCLNYIKLDRQYGVGITCYPTQNISRNIQYNTTSALSTKSLGF